MAPSWCWWEGRELGEGGTFLRLDRRSARPTPHTWPPCPGCSLCDAQRGADHLGLCLRAAWVTRAPLRTPPRSRRRDEERTWAPGGPVPAETYRMPGGGAGAIHTWQVADTGKYNISAIRGEKTKRFDNHLH